MNEYVYIVKSNTTDLYPKGSKFCTTCVKPKCPEYIIVIPKVDGKKKTVTRRLIRASCCTCEGGIPKK